ncbi:4933405L10Rik [Phodopus roborovskii]|uniref:4933405L10Rik protein n=1 Tax=Phodopus roborovskii TaxID=109678 RepID=A0AAU9ZZ91_PHORO|nr:4933405L10Rik [Phodopus roborovskii]
MASAGAKRQPEAQNGATIGLAQVAEIPECPGPGEKCLVPAHETCRTLGEDKYSVGHSFEPELQEEGINRGEEGINPGVETGEERGPKPTSSIVRPSHGPKRKPIKAEAELPPGMLLPKEEPEGSHSESSLSAKQHKKAKKRKSVGAPVPPAVAGTSTPTETLGLEPFALPRVLAGKAQRLRPLYQYINYCNPELNQAGDGDRESEVEPESELALAPEEAGVEQLQLQAWLPVTGELGLALALPCPNTLVPLTHTPPSLGQELGEEPGGLCGLRMSGSLKAEVDKTTQVDIDKMLSVCAAPLVPPLSPQYK